MTVTDGVVLDTLYPIKVAFNGSGPAGGDSVEQNLNVRYEAGDVGFVLTATCLALLMIPGVGFVYSGLLRRKSTLSSISVSVLALAVTSVQWFLCGYSLSFSHTASPFIGDLANAGFRNVLAQPSVSSYRIPDLLFAIYHGMLSAFAVALSAGAIAERGRILTCIVFMFIWATVVYDPIACWTWNPIGWSNKMGGLDFAGGTPIHITSGAAALAYSMMLGKRRGHGTYELQYRPHNTAHIVLGTVLLWIGWLGANTGSALSANIRAVMAGFVTNLSACAGAITWCVLDYRLEGKFSAVGLCSGAVAGLVSITPGSGYVPCLAAIIFGVLSAGSANFATSLKFRLGIDDALDIFAVHGISALVGNICTGLFAVEYIAHLDNRETIPGGWLNHHWPQPAYQVADSMAAGLYSFFGTCLILFIMSVIPGLRPRMVEKSEILGTDDMEIGEFAYDYVELTREILHFPKNEMELAVSPVLRSSGSGPIPLATPH